MGPLVVIDHGICNVGSVANMLRKTDVNAIVSGDPKVLAGASAIILPGIGAFDHGMQELDARGLTPVIKDRVARGVPILGICLGMQLLTRKSEEGVLPGLGLVAADTVKFQLAAQKLAVPHMGWNETRTIDRTLFDGFDPDKTSDDGGARFYYVHSYYVKCDDRANVAAECTYGITFTSAIRAGHVFGTQFHPEKSHKFGLRVLTSFVAFTGHAARAA